MLATIIWGGAKLSAIATPDVPAVQPATSGSVVAARDVTRVYGEGETAVHALRGVSVDFPRGQFAAIMLLPRGIRRAFESTFAALEAGLGSG